MKPKNKIKILEAELKGLYNMSASSNRERIDEVEKEIESLKLCDKFGIPIKLIKAKDAQTFTISNQDVIRVIENQVKEVLESYHSVPKPKEAFTITPTGNIIINDRFGFVEMFRKMALAYMNDISLRQITIKKKDKNISFEPS